ncbi:hypothetical protein [Thermococcus sp. Bubb.Bath]|uniref:hypothetical protein n=1 Tax=Thermococcus sp. Bubb.Bath TaxID=1638242 RepID=UPI00143BA538|nr:hypothetical protein [Thermococcus sp. Bubb.Bath]NJF24461.1 hypothetical protein [Thermococcus sp. Bubb.Bath]
MKVLSHWRSMAIGVFFFAVLPASFICYFRLGSLPALVLFFSLSLLESALLWNTKIERANRELKTEGKTLILPKEMEYLVVKYSVVKNPKKTTVETAEVSRGTGKAVEVPESSCLCSRKMMIRKAMCIGLQLNDEEYGGLIVARREGRFYLLEDPSFFASRRFCR